jgi:hypothetical protein
MANTAVDALLQLFQTNAPQDQPSAGKKILGIIAVIKPHTRMLFGTRGSFNSTGVLKFSDKSLELYVIRYGLEDTTCYRGRWSGGENITWESTVIKPSTEPTVMSPEQTQSLESELSAYFTPDNFVDSIEENNPKAGYFIPIYP